jgi:hypothetical protein
MVNVWPRELFRSEPRDGSRKAIHCWRPCRSRAPSQSTMSWLHAPQLAVNFAMVGIVLMRGGETGPENPRLSSTL